jgi:hypothetical protein
VHQHQDRIRETYNRCINISQSELGSVATVQHTTQFLTDEFLNEANFPDMLYLAAEK